MVLLSVSNTLKLKISFKLTFGGNKVCVVSVIKELEQLVNARERERERERRLK
ncbi:MAG: hypothetical protein LBC44_01820 [Mycoplasmataceae bacterium]|jgi:hypothetical protein|nr:hypothetical protein [Mycoplasmataceae bacterium]